jgi:hypothetical protein
LGEKKRLERIQIVVARRMVMESLQYLADRFREIAVITRSGASLQQAIHQNVKE